MKKKNKEMVWEGWNPFTLNFVADKKYEKGIVESFEPRELTKEQIAFRAKYKVTIK